MKNLFSSSLETLKQSITSKENQNSSLVFQNAILSRKQLSAIKGGDDSADDDIVIADIIGG